jgi:hypothetical protein
MSGPVERARAELDWYSDLPEGSTPGVVLALRDLIAHVEEMQRTWIDPGAMPPGSILIHHPGGDWYAKLDRRALAASHRGSTAAEALAAAEREVTDA